jgi:hypothetical protein
MRGLHAVAAPVAEDQDDVAMPDVANPVLFIQRSFFEIGAEIFDLIAPEKGMDFAPDLQGVL